MNLSIQLWHGDCVKRLAELPVNSVGAIICDPPYDILFMSKSWDGRNILTNEEIWAECLRVLEPSGIIKAFAATRTYHRLCRSLRKTGFVGTRLEAWIHSQGFPKSTNISKRIDKQAGAEREVVGYKRGVGGENLNDIVRGVPVRQTTDTGAKGVGAYGTGAKQKAIELPITRAATPDAKLWEGYGTALKPSWEPIVVARKPG